MSLDSSVKLGTVAQSSDKILANLKTALPAVVKVIKGGWDNVQSLSLKTSTSVSLPIWTCDLGAEAGGRWEGLIADVEMSGSEEEDVEDDEGEDEEEEEEDNDDNDDESGDEEAEAPKVKAKGSKPAPVLKVSKKRVAEAEEDESKPKKKSKTVTTESSSELPKPGKRTKAPLISLAKSSKSTAESTSPQQKKTDASKAHRCQSHRTYCKSRRQGSLQTKAAAAPGNCSFRGDSRSIGYISLCANLFSTQTYQN